jgi:hypothetical protein
MKSVERVVLGEGCLSLTQDPTCRPEENNSLVGIWTMGVARMPFPHAVPIYKSGARVRLVIEVLPSKSPRRSRSKR